MRPVFELLPNLLTIHTEKSELFIEISSGGLSYAVRDGKDQSFCGVAFYQFDKNNTAEEISGEITQAFMDHSIVNNPFGRVVIIYAMNDLLLIPADIAANTDIDKALYRVYGDIQECKTLKFEVPGTDIINAFRIPNSILEIVNEQFPDHQTVHVSSLLLKDNPASGDQIRIIFRHGYMTVVVFKNTAIQLVNDYYFTSAEDAIWQLLNIAERLDLKNPVLKCGGLIETKSKLFQEVLLYFPLVELDQLPASTAFDETIRDLPEHYFSNLFTSALCVSSAESSAAEK